MRRVYEYMLVTLMPHLGDELSVGEIQGCLNKYGEVGWELVSIIENKTFRQELFQKVERSSGYKFFLKRLSEE
mgnify:CR=1 FL=1